VHSLTTLCSAHHGLTLIDKSKQSPLTYGSISHSEKAFEALGLSLRNAEEFFINNMKDFNEVALDAENVQYYSFGAKRKEL